ncbi:leucine-rich repeat-containing protein 66 [Leptonychotes weddellii]|uniref:Leucine-rich repeat-containing protein 66 n=1 Tax=Leptonychotes weddellii TaxID=9713 RepID=A0A2U3Y6I9_LEPWE|nr:leucine-rich repeat-containing protein 66 [Leptonychotes weddellii]
MKNLHFRVLTMLIGLYFTGTMTNPSRKSSLLFSSECQWNGYLLTNCSFTGKHDIHVDRPQPAATVDTRASFLRALLRSHMRKEDWNTKHLDLSNNRIPNITLSPLAHFHALEVLNLSNSSLLSIALDLRSAKSSCRKRHRSSWRHGLPFLKLLILQRNKLADIPNGLWKLKSLQSLDLSFNGIAQIGLSDLRHCLRLENLYLKSNKIFRIHPEAFKDLKKLQVVDLSNNVLTTILPMMVIALELPHLEVDLADNQWECDCSVAAFQKVLSESWRKTWNVICSKSVGNEEADQWTLQSGISKETHLPHGPAKPVKSLPPGQSKRPQAGWFERPGTAWRKGPAGAPASERPRRLPRGARSPRDVPTAGRQGDTSQDLALAVCLAVFITFFVAFCLGAFARPFIDRLWHQRCARKRPSSDNGDNADNAYSNKGFCDDTEAAGNAQHLRTDRPLQEPASPRAAVIPNGPLGECGREPGRWQSRGPCGDSRGPGGGKEYILLSDSAAHSILQGQPNAGHNQRIPAGQDHIHRKDALGEVNYATLAQEGSPSVHSAGAPVRAGRLQTVSGSIHSDSGELNAPLSGEMAASLSQMQTHTKAQGAGENERLPSEFSKEMQVGTYLNLQDTQQQRLQGASAEEGLPASHGAVPLSDVEPGQKHAPPDPQYPLDSSYDSDSDEGSLFTLSSTSSEDARNVTEEEAHGEKSHRASEPPEDENSGVRKDNVTSSEDPEDNIPCQKILEKCENQEDCFENPLISGPDSGLCETHLEGASNTNTFEGPLTVPGSLGSNSPSGDETPGMVICDYAAALRSEAVEWHYSLRDLEFLNVDVVPQTPPWSAEVPSDPDQSDCRERDSDIYKYEPCLQEMNTAQNDVPLKITAGENLGASQQNSEGGNMNPHLTDTDANEGLACTLEDSDSRKVRSRTQLLQSCSDEPALQCERGERGYAESRSRSQVPLLQELPSETSLPGTQEPFNGRDWGKYSEENLLQLENIQTQTQGHLLGAGLLYEDLLYYDVELENQREFK